MSYSMRARRARSALPALVVALGLATGGFAYASVDGGSSTADIQPDEGTPGTAPGGTADMTPSRGVKPPTSVAPGSTAGLLPGASQVPPSGTGGDVDQSDRGTKGVKPTKDRGTKNAPATKG